MFPSDSAAVIDSQSVKTAAGVDEAVGYDAGKQIRGRKRFISVDTLGLLLRVKQMGKGASRLHTIWVDGGFDGEPFMQCKPGRCHQKNIDSKISTHEY